ncbi:MAG TPA: hypothetical protein PLN94_06385, partial [Thiolinea sp.]|nr:hypothetical protein [Thiolinea sp.]
MMYENEAVSSKKRDLLDRKHVEHIKSQQRSLLLLKLAMLITFLLYLMFNLHLYLGDFTTWGSYFDEMAAIAGFSFALVIAILMAGFLSWVKHHAYLHFGLHGSVPLLLVTVIGFALFAELFSSSASQDAKTHLMLNNNSAYQQTLQAPGSVNAPSPIVMGSGLAVDIAAAQQRLARCEENLKRGREKHCNGDKAKLDALESSQQAQLQAQTQATIAASKAQAQANLEAQKLNFERQDQLKADSYNSSIVTIAKFISGIFGNDYTDNIKTATVICMLFVAICFEILHHFLSASKEKADMAVDGIELEIAKLDGNKTEFKPMEEKSVNTEARNNNPGFGFSAPATAQSKGYFKYQNETEEPKSTKNP